MIYSFLVLSFGIFLGQEYNLPSVKNAFLYTYNFLNERKKVKNDNDNVNNNDNENNNDNTNNVNNIKSLFDYFW